MQSPQESHGGPEGPRHSQRGFQALTCHTPAQIPPSPTRGMLFLCGQRHMTRLTIGDSVPSPCRAITTIVWIQSFVRTPNTKPGPGPFPQPTLRAQMEPLHPPQASPSGVWPPSPGTRSWGTRAEARSHCNPGQPGLVPLSGWVNCIVWTDPTFTCSPTEQNAIFHPHPTKGGSSRAHHGQ